jgi:hypothetical protein
MMWENCECYCDYDEPIQFRKAVDPIAKKEHKCEECGCTIKPGEKYHYETYLCDRKFWKYKACYICWSIAMDRPCFSFGGLREEILECEGFDYVTNDHRWEEEEKVESV